MHRSLKKNGRPPKNGVVAPGRFLRALMVIHAFSKARAGGQKHSADVREAVEFVRQLDPEMPISETEVKRVLAEFLPRASRSPGWQTIPALLISPRPSAWTSAPSRRTI
jgi:hypothetical protein